MSKKIDISTRIGKNRFRSPIFLASGVVGFGEEYGGLVDFDSVGAFITKTITMRPREGNPPPRIWETSSGMLNSIGLANPGAERFVKEYIPRLEGFPCPVVVSIGGETIEELAGIANMVCMPFVKAVELNLSCPNVKSGGIHFGKDPDAIYEAVKSVKEATEKDIWAKLPPMVTDIVRLARSACDAGASGVVVANTFPAMAIDIYARRSRLGTYTGGLSGPAIHPIVAYLVFSLRRKLDISIVACGGVSNPEDVIELMLAGASAVQIGSGIFSDANLPKRCFGFLKDYMQRLGYRKVEQFVGGLNDTQ